MKNKRYTICCPLCGIPLFRSSVTDSDVKCFKCRSDLQIRLMRGELVIREADPEKVREVVE